MPVHDWSTVSAGTFHHFHQAWITALSDALNDGLLPDGYYAMAEQVAGGPQPDVLALEETEPPADWPGVDGGSDAGIALAVHPPKVRYTLEAEETLYAAKANRVAVYHTSGDRVVAFLKIVSPGNTRSQVAWRSWSRPCSKVVICWSSTCIVQGSTPPTDFTPRSGGPRRA